MCRRYTPSGSGVLRARVFEFSAAMDPAAAAIGFTPLHYAVLMAHDAVAQRLLAAGADPTLADASGETPAACVCGCVG